MFVVVAAQNSKKKDERYQILSGPDSSVHAGDYKGKGRTKTTDFEAATIRYKPWEMPWKDSDSK